ncbi:TOBE domain-containing protein, partial [Methylogaea oryzae]|uniref:TOBE domain-containing protein n=1 Tax=Methylogaea oryzae TaxID=1295382 RepID=UPI000A4FA4EB
PPRRRHGAHRAGQSLLGLYRRLQEEHRQFLRGLNDDLAADPEFLFLARRMLMKASARNQFFGKVAEVRPGAVNAEVVVSLKGGDTLVAAVTMESLQTLGIAADVDVVALVKAPQVVIVTDMGPYRLSARNQLTGSVVRVQKGAVNAEVVIQLPGGDTVYATVTNDAVEDLGLKEGSAATAVFKAGAVILGVAA